MISTTPLRRMILHRSQRGLTDARTFMTCYILSHLAAVQSAANSSRQPLYFERLGRPTSALKPQRERRIIRPRVRSNADRATRTRSPGMIRPAPSRMPADT